MTHPTLLGHPWFSHFFASAGLCLAIATLVTGCDKKADERPAEPVADPARPLPSPQPSPPHPPAAPKPAAHASSLSWTDPEGWQRGPDKPMRLATYRVPGKGGDAELAVFYFGPGSAGGVEANVERWLGQFEGLDEQSVERDKRTANGLNQHVVGVKEGTFRGGMPMAPSEPKKDTGMLAAIVEAPEGAHFFKMTGPADTVAGARTPFFEMLDSVRPKAAK